MVTAARVGVFTCCTPKRWTATAREVRMSVDNNGAVQHRDTWHIVTYDANDERVAVTTFTEDEPIIFNRQILNYRQRERYVIQGQQQQKCTRHPLTRPFHSACVPGNTTEVYFARVGESNPGSSPGLWENTAYFYENDVAGYATVTMVDCALVAEVAYGDLGGGAVSVNIQYLNQTLNWVDPRAFALPPSCPTDP
ncbi:hypothetical protein BaRGS_00024124, partial [Batillaria attramentaria]